MVDVSSLIQKQLFDIQRNATEAAEKHLVEFLAFQKLTIEDFVKDYVFEWRPTQIEDAITGTVGMDLDLRPDTTTVKFVTYFRIRRKTDRDRVVENEEYEPEGDDPDGE